MEGLKQFLDPKIEPNFLPRGRNPSVSPDMPSIVELEASQRASTRLRNLGNTMVSGLNQPTPHSPSPPFAHAQSEHGENEYDQNYHTGDDWYSRKDMKSVNEMANEMKPRWDGDPLSWNRFFKEWNFYWSLKAPFMGNDPKVVGLAFMKCLPKEEAERVKNFIIDGKGTFEDLIAKYQAQCSSVIPRFALERKWKNCLPYDRKWRSIDLWYSKWHTFAADVGNLTEEQMKEQFDFVLIKLHPKLISQIHEEEVSGKKLTLEQRWNFVANKLRVQQTLSHISSEYDSARKDSNVSSIEKRGRSPSRGKGKGKGHSSDRSRSPRSKDTAKCYNCGREGHYASNCRRRTPSQSSRSSSQFSRRSSQSGSSRHSKYSRGRRGYVSSRGKYYRRASRSPRYSTQSRSSSSGHSRTQSRTGTRERRPTPKSRTDDRAQLLRRQKSGRCLKCGSPSHKVNDCPRRSRTPPRNSRYGGKSQHQSSSRQKVGFKTSKIQEEDPASGREGDVVDSDEEEVEEYLAVRHMKSYFPSGKSVADYAIETDNE